MLVQAHGWLDLVRNGQARTVGDIAGLMRLQESYIYKHLKLTLLAPDIQKAILEGTQPRSLSLEAIKAGDYTQDWKAQREKLGSLESKGRRQLSAKSSHFIYRQQPGGHTMI